MWGYTLPLCLLPTSLAQFFNLCHLCVAALADLPPLGVSMRRAHVDWYSKKELCGSENQSQGTAKQPATRRMESVQFGWKHKAYKGKGKNQGPQWETPLPEALGKTQNQLPANWWWPLLLSATGKSHKCHNSCHHHCLFLLTEWKKQKGGFSCSMGSRVSPCPQLTRDHRLSAVASGWSVPMANLMSWRLKG